MKNFLLAFLVFLVWSAIGMWYYGCVIKGVCREFSIDSTNNTVADEVITIDPAIEKQRVADSIAEIENQNRIAAQEEQVRLLEQFNTSDFKVVNKQNGKIIFYYPNPVTIYKDRVKMYIPPRNRDFYFEYINFIERNPTATLHIYAAYDPNTEQVKTDSLGIGRAQYLKNRLIRVGANPDNIRVHGVEQDLNFDFKGRNYKGIYLELDNVTTEEPLPVSSSNNDGNAFIGISNSGLNRTIHAGFANNSFRPTNELRLYAMELLNYLKLNPTKRITVIGHTDNTGNTEDNTTTGMKYARIAGDFLVTVGIPANNLKIFSRGDSSPIVPNSSDYNRSMNRRIEIKVN